MKRTALLALLTLLAFTAPAKTITGKVLVDGKPRPDVVVSDGINVVTTDDKGRYTMDSEHRQHVFVSVPADCEIPLDAQGQPLFYQEIDTTSVKTQKINFNLKGSEKKSDWTLLVLADVQIGYDKDYTDLRDSVMPLLVDSVKLLPAPVYAISLGDIVWNNPDFYTNYRKELSKIGVPIFSVIGNHDHNEITQGDSMSDLEFRNAMGPTYYSVNIGDCHIVALDDIIYRGYTRRGDYTCGITQQQIDWLKQDLKHVPKSKTLVIGLHAPTAYRWGHPNIENAEKLYDLVKDFNDVQILSGHTHNNFTTTIAPNITETTHGAVNGAFWYPICNDGSPRGHGVMRFEGSKLADKYYKGFDTPREYQIRMYEPSEAVLCKPNAKKGDKFKKILVNVFGWHTDWKVEVSENGKDWVELTTADRVSRPAVDPGVVMLINPATGYLSANHGGSHAAKYNDHMFLYKPSKGWKKVRARATDPFGHVYTAELVRTAN